MRYVYNCRLVGSSGRQPGLPAAYHFSTTSKGICGHLFLYVYIDGGWADGVQDCVLKNQFDDIVQQVLRMQYVNALSA